MSLDIEELLSRQEGANIDFKRDQYPLDSKSAKVDFVKDIICLANTRRDGPAHIVIGVEKLPDGTSHVVGVDDHPDDADLQSTVESRVHPLPPFSYEPHTYEGKSIGVVTIPTAGVGPATPTSDYGDKLRKWTIYYRSSSKNSIAPPDQQANIRSWFGKDDSGQRSVPLSQCPSTPWERFVRATDGFQSGRVFILAVDPVEQPEAAAGLGLVDWHAVLDFDPNSATSGLLSICEPMVSRRRHLHQVVIGNRPTVSARGSYWFAAKGMSANPATIVSDEWLSWNAKYGNEINDLFARLAEATQDRPAVVIGAMSDPDFLGTVFQAANTAFADRARFVIAGRNAAQMSVLAQQFQADTVDISLEGIASGLAQGLAAEATEVGDGCWLPSRDGPLVQIPQADLPWLEEELELLARNEGGNQPAGRDTGVAFLLGAVATWFEIGLHCDVDREVTPKLLKQLRHDLTTGTTTRVNLYHSPGAGGTTVARRVAWELHRDFPTVLLHACSGDETVGRLERLTEATSLPVLCVAEGAELSERQIEDLVSCIRARQVPVVLLQVLRRFGKQEERARAFWLSGKLTADEASRFAHVYGSEVPDRRAKLEELASSHGSQNCTPFYFGLEAFERDFETLATYVKSYTATLSPPQMTALTYSALAHYYGQRGIHIQAFSSLFGIPRSRALSFEDLFSQPARELLVLESNGLCRTTHNLVAEEILVQALAPGAHDRRVWKQNLSVWAKKFLDFCSPTEGVVSQDTMELVDRLFVYRDNVDLLGTERSATKAFAELLQHIPRPEGRLVVMEHLTNVFPGEAHFWAHLGRFCSWELRDFERAEAEIDKAIRLSQNDHVLHHMRGMVVRNRVYDAIRSQYEVEAVLALADRATQAFEEARALQPTDQHGYISEIQMIIRVLDYAGEKAGMPPAEIVASFGTDPRLQEAIGRAEDLLAQAGSIRKSEEANPYEAQCRIGISDLYGDYSSVLQGWHNLLSRSDVYHPPIRREIVWAYLSRAGDSWTAMSAQDLERIVHHLEDNLLEEPNDARNIRLWVRAVRRLRRPPSLEAIIERVAYWNANADELEAAYYLYVMHALKAIQGSQLSVEEAKRALDDCRKKAQGFVHRTRSYEWLGSGTGVSRLVHQSELGEWNRERNFWPNTARLDRIAGTITEIKGPQAGRITLECGLRAFFVPGPAGVAKGRDENTRVTFFLGFSYDGLRAWDPKRVPTEE